MLTATSRDAAPQNDGPRDNRIIVLDTSCVTGAPRVALEELRARGFRLRVSGLAVSELSVHRLRDAKDAKDAKQLRIKWDRVRAIGPLLDASEPIAPTHAALVSKLGGVGPNPVDYRVWRDNISAVWEALGMIGPLEAALEEYVARGASYVESTGADFVETIAEAGLFPDDDGWSERALVEWIATVDALHWDSVLQIPGPPTVPQRFDAWHHVAALQFARAGRVRAGQAACA